jgi:hypothetical protein
VTPIEPNVINCFRCLRISRPISRLSLDTFDRRVLAEREHSIGQEFVEVGIEEIFAGCVHGPVCLISEIDLLYLEKNTIDPKYNVK